MNGSLLADSVHSQWEVKFRSPMKKDGSPVREKDILAMKSWFRFGFCPFIQYFYKNQKEWGFRLIF